MMLVRTMNGVVFLDAAKQSVTVDGLAQSTLFMTEWSTRTVKTALPLRKYTYNLTTGLLSVGWHKQARVTKDWDFQWEEVIGDVASDLLVRTCLTLLSHRVSGDDVLKGLRAEGVDVTGWKLTNHYLGGWLVKSEDKLVPVAELLSHIESANA